LSENAVIARLGRTCALGRAIQYPEAVVIEPRGRSVLDAPPSRGLCISEAVIWGRYSHRNRGAWVAKDGAPGRSARHLRLGWVQDGPALEVHGCEREIERSGIAGDATMAGS